MLLNEVENNSTDRSQIKSFSINGLFGSQDVEIPFNDNVVILIGENGSGKTTILNAIYYTITCQLSKLKHLNFKSIVIEFESRDKLEIKKIPFENADKLNIQVKTIISSFSQYADTPNCLRCYLQSFRS